jgi:hypothetical protein
MIPSDETMVTGILVAALVAGDGSLPEGMHGSEPDLFLSARVGHELLHIRNDETARKSDINHIYNQRFDSRTTF